MKIAISGKGGVGKTFISAFLSEIFAESGYSVIAIDADPDANLAATLNFPEADHIVPISEMKDLIAERTGATKNGTTSFFKLNPRVSDIPEKFAACNNGIRLMVMGRVKKGGSGCYCPENTFLRTLLTHLLLARDEVIILDMEAGLEHLGRGTASMVDKMIIVVEPGQRSIETARRIRRLANDIGLNNLAIIANKIRNEAHRELLLSSLADFEFLGFISYDAAITEADMMHRPLFKASLKVASEVRNVYQTLLSSINRPDKNK